MIDLSRYPEVSMTRVGRSSGTRKLALVGVGVLLATFLIPARAAQADPRPDAADRTLTQAKPTFTRAAGFDISKPVRELARTPRTATRSPAGPQDLRPERGPIAPDRGHQTDGALQAKAAPRLIPGTLANFEGLSNQNNFNLLARRVNPPDPVGDVGPNHYVEMVNIVFAVFSKTGARLAGPLALGSLWAGFPITECADNSGDPIVIYDQFADRWILTQFTTRGSNFPMEPANLFYNCVAISTTPDPTGTYYRYAFSTGFNFPDYPKYGIWGDSYLVTTREFGTTDPSVYGIGVYGLERAKMIAGDPTARSVGFLLQSGRVPINLIGDGLLPADSDGTTPPKADAPAPIVGTQDDGGPYGATFDALNIWEFAVKWDAAPSASIGLKAQLPVAAFDSIFPCAPAARKCLPQPGITDPNLYLDVLSYRQRPTWRLAHRTFGSHETLVTNQTVEARPGVAGLRWYEIRRKKGTYTLQQQGTFAPDDGVNRWMASAAMDRKGNMAIGYSVVNGTNLFPSIRYTGRMARDPAGELTLGEGTITNGSAAQTSTNSRWGDYTSLNVDPVDDCTFWYVNEYYTAEGAAQAPLGNGWQTRIASFRLPKC
jgi:hypothetical protein